MSAQGGLLESPYQMDSNAAAMSAMRAVGAAAKRKRDSLDSDGQAMRASPNNRRSSSHYPPQTVAGGPMVTANMTNPGDNAFMAQSGSVDDQSQHFDLSALQAHQNTNGGVDGAEGTSINTAAAALNHYTTMSVPQHPAADFMNTPTAAEIPQMSSEYQGMQDNGQDESPGEHGSMPRDGLKPTVGSDEWHKVRKDNHKEVERRRRETINEGINELAKIVPGSEKNKGSILARAVQYIQKLHDDATQNIDKWTFEKLVTEQAIADLSQKLNRVYQEKEAWKRVAAEAGVDVEGVLREGRLAALAGVGAGGAEAEKEMGEGESEDGEGRREEGDGKGGEGE